MWLVTEIELEGCCLDNQKYKLYATEDEAIKEFKRAKDELKEIYSHEDSDTVIKYNEDYNTNDHTYSVFFEDDQHFCTYIECYYIKVEGK